MIIRAFTLRPWMCLQRCVDQNKATFKHFEWYYNIWLSDHNFCEDNHSVYSQIMHPSDLSESHIPYIWSHINLPHCRFRAGTVFLTTHVHRCTRTQGNVAYGHQRETCTVVQFLIWSNHHVFYLFAKPRLVAGRDMGRLPHCKPHFNLESTQSPIGVENLQATLYSKVVVIV